MRVLLRLLNGCNLIFALIIVPRMGQQAKKDDKKKKEEKKPAAAPVKKGSKSEPEAIVWTEKETDDR